jgi:hypothetical protein
VKLSAAAVSVAGKVRKQNQADQPGPHPVSGNIGEGSMETLEIQSNRRCSV